MSNDNETKPTLAAEIRVVSTQCPCGRARVGCDYHDPMLDPTPPEDQTFPFMYDGVSYNIEIKEDDTAKSIAFSIALATGGTVQPDGSVLLPGVIREVVISGTLSF